MIVYSPLQRRWLRHHFARWTVAYGWSAAEVRPPRPNSPHDALAEALGLPVEDFAGPVEDFGSAPPGRGRKLAHPLLDPPTPSGTSPWRYPSPAPKPSSSSRV